MDRRLEYVLAVVNCGSFTAAAREIGISQPGMTRAISDLERELGYALFDRTARGALPTEKGRDFSERARRVIDDVQLLLRGEQDRDPFACVLRIGVGPSSLEWLMAAPLAALLSRHPAIRFDVVGGSFERIAHLLRSGAIDIAIGYDEAFAERRDVRRQPLSMLDTVLFVRKGHPALAEKLKDAGDLTRYDFVVPSESRPYATLVRNLFEADGRSWQRHIHLIDNFQIVRRIVQGSDVIGVAARAYAQSAAFARNFEQLPIECPFPPAALCLAMRANWDPTPASRALASVLQKFMPAQR